MIAATTKAITASSSTMRSSEICPVCIWSNVVSTATGRLTTMPAKMSSDMPLPMPRSVICSPSHMMNMVPVISVITQMKRKPQPGL